MFKAFILLVTIMNASAEVYRFRFRGIDPIYAYQPYAILLLRESVACRAGVSYEKVLLEGINGPDGYKPFTSDSSENRMKVRAPVQCAITNNMHWDTGEVADPINLMELMTEPIYEYQLFVPVDNLSRINYMNFLSGSVNEKYADVLGANPHSFYDGQPYHVSNHSSEPVLAEEQHLFQLIVLILFVECALIAGLRYIIKCLRGLHKAGDPLQAGRGQPYIELSQVVVEPVMVAVQPIKGRQRSSSSVE